MRALILLLLCGCAYSAPWTGILAPERAMDWTTAGIPGGIPVRTQVCASVTTSNTTAEIQSAIDNCTVGQVVSFGAGTFNISSISVAKGITLRGQGPTQTYLNVSGNVTLGIGDNYNGHAPAWTGGLTRGSKVLTVASTSGLSAGMVVSLDELNPAWINTMGINDDCGSSNECGRAPGYPWFYQTGSARALFQLTKIVSVDSGTQITIKDPVAYTHSASLSPTVFWWDGGNVEGAGIESMKVYSNGNAATVDISHCDYCYARNLSIRQNGRGAIHTRWSYGFVIKDNYIDSTNINPTSTQYGYEIVASSRGLVENNIAFTVTAPFMPENNFGTVYAYNYTLNHAAVMGGSTFQFPDAEPHLAQNAFQLWEGNVMGMINYDQIWGSGSHGTLFRNNLYSHQPGMTQNSVAVQIGAYNRFINAVGNVLGDTAFSTQYQCATGGSNQGAIYDIGNPNRCQGGTTSGNVSYDPVTLSSMMRWGNWDAVTYIANGNTNGVRRCTASGAGNPACTADERGLDSTYPFPGLTSPATTLPASLYNGTTGVHASCGTGLSFWKNPSTGYCPPYPPIGPEVTCTVNCNSGTANHAAKIPAQLCYENSAKDGDGYLTAFDAAACYANDPGAKPNVPTNVHGWR